MGAGRNGNLKPASEQTPEERAENGRKGGINSGKAKRKAKSMREAARLLLEAPLQDSPEVQEALEKLGLEPDQQGAVLLAALQRSKIGDIEASRFIRDTSGQSPAQAVELSGPDGGPIENLNLSELSNDQLSALLARSENSENGA